MPNDFISRKAILAKQYEAEGHCGLSTKVVDVRDIEDEPASDVVEVVRCKDCEQYIAGELGYGKCNFFKAAIFSEFYCRYGGKKGRSE